MRAHVRLFPTLLLAGLLAGCESDRLTAPEPTDMERFGGTWIATGWVFTPIGGGPGVSAMPISFRITITPSTTACSDPVGGTIPAGLCGTCVVDQHFQQDPGPRHLEGTIGIIRLATVWIGAAETGGDVEHFIGAYAFSNGDDTVTLTSVEFDPDDPDDIWKWDFDGDGELESATLTITLERQ